MLAGNSNKTARRKLDTRCSTGGTDRAVFLQSADDARAGINVDVYFMEGAAVWRCPAKHIYCSTDVDLRVILDRFGEPVQSRKVRHLILKRFLSWQLPTRALVQDWLISRKVIH